MGKIQLVAGQRKLGKDEQARLLPRCDLDQSKVLGDVGADVTSDGDRLSGGDRASTRHIHPCSGSDQARALKPFRIQRPATSSSTGELMAIRP